MAFSNSKFRFLILTSFLLCQLSFINFKSLAQSLSATRTLPSDWWGTNAHDITHGHELMSSDSLVYKNWKKTKVEVLRHPADGYPNDWDWDKGYFITNGKFPPQLPQFDLNKHKNLFTDFQSVAGTIGAGINIDINPVSSNLSYQLTGLKLASGIGLKVMNIEIGEEIYGANVLQNYVYPSASVYGDTCKKWIDSIKKYFPSANVAVVGAPTDGDVRKFGWNTDLLSSANLINKTIDAVTIHYYPSSGIIDSGVYVSKQQIPTMMEYPYITNHCLREDISDIHLVKPSAKIWITEYNMTDKAQRIHGSWAHGLFTTLQTMLLLEDSTVTQLLLFSTSGSGVRGLLFQDSTGLTDNEYVNFSAPYQCSGGTCPITNEKWQYTAVGNSMRLFATAIRGMNRTAQINFPSAPYFGTDPTHKKIYGWMFTDASTMNSAPSRNLIILNLDSVDHTIGLGSFNVAGGQYEQVWSYDPLVFAGGNAVYNSSDHASVTTPGGFPTIHTSRNPASINLSQRIASGDTASFKLRAYSITYIHNYSGSPTLTASADTICSGQYVTLKATGGAYYTWSVTSGTYTLDGDTSNYISVHPTATGTVTSTYTFKVKAWNNGGTSNGTVTKSIVVRPSPTSFTVTDTLSGCNVIMTASNSAYNYTWFPAIGLSATTGQSVTSSNNPRTYVVIASFNPTNQCTYSESHVASRIDSGNHYLAFLNLGQAFNQGNDVMHFGGASDSTKGYPTGGYIILRKYNENGVFVHKDSIPKVKLQGTGHMTIPCDTAGTYRLTYHYEGVTGCSSDTLRQIIFVNRVKVDAAYTVICPNHVLQLQQTHYDNPSGFNFYWSGPVKHLYTKKNPAVSDTIHVSISYQKVFFKSDTAKNYVVTLTVKKGTKVCSQNTITVTVSGICSYTKGDSSWVDISASQLLGDLQNIQCNTTYNGNIKYGNKLYLYGTFTIDQDLHFLNTQSDSLTLVFGNNAQVNVNAYKMLELDSVHAYSCGDSTWNGIIQKGVGSNITTNRSWIEDANYALYADYGGTIVTSKTNFEDNYIGIWFEGRNTLYDYGSSTVLSSSFKTVNGLKQPYASYGKGYSGIRIDSTSGVITIGSNTTGLENSFDSLYSGVNGFTNFDVNLYRNIFTRIKGTYGGTPQDFEGKAGYIKTGTVAPSDIVITGTGMNATSPAINNCDYGFFVTGYTNTTVSDYRIDNTPHGIDIENANGGSMNMYSNKITNTKYGALFLLNKYCTQNIYGNDISVKSPPNIQNTGYFGISIQDFTGAYSTNEVYDNTITDGRYAIYLLNNGSNSNIHDNTINMTSTQTLQGNIFGIYSEACTGIKLTHNIITGNVADYNLNYKKQGIQLYQSQNCEVTCDSVNKVGYGFHFKGNCLGTTFQSNQIGVSGGSSPNGAYYGVVRERFNNQEGIGTQGDTMHSHSNGFYGPFTSPGNFAALHNATITNERFWYNPSHSAPFKTFSQTQINNGQFFQFFPSSIASLEGCQSGMLRDEETGNEDTSSLTGELEDFATQQLNDSIGEVPLWWNQRILLREVKNDSSVLSQSETLSSFNDSLQNAPVNDLLNFESQLSQFNESEDGPILLTDLITFNNSIFSSKNYESNEKELNAIYLNSIATGMDTFSEDQKAFITWLAFSCPFKEGAAVFKARALYPLIADSTGFFDDDSLCKEESGKKSIPLQSPGLILYPNPTSNSVAVELSEERDNEFKLIIVLYDSYGTVVKKLTQTTPQFTIDVSDLPSGMYLMKVNSIQSQIISRLITVVR